MILQALKKYYDRRSADPDSDIAPDGWEKKAISFVIVLDADGHLVQIEDTRVLEGGKKVPKPFTVPLGVKRASGIEANLLWDTMSYVFGEIGTDISLENDHKKQERMLKRAPEQQKSFIGKIRQFLPNDLKAQKIIDFLDAVTEDDLIQSPCWIEMKQSNALVSFRFQGENHLFCEDEDIRRKINDQYAQGKQDGFCLITGEKAEICKLHTSLKGVRGAQSSGASIVSFNLDSFCSYGKKQGFNAPIGKSGMFAYTTALNELLQSGSKQKLTYGDVTFVFWSAQPTEFESVFSLFFSEPATDDPRAQTDQVKNLLNAPQTGAYVMDSGSTEFYVLGLSPNAARISVRMWRMETVSRFAAHIRQYFEDIKIVKPSNEPEFYSLRHLLVNIAVQGKSENIPPNITNDLMMSILDGTPFPASILQAALRRVIADTSRRVTSARAALIKGYLNRYVRMYPNKEDREMGVSLDVNHPSVGYQLGRLFATLEMIQKDASKGDLNSTITERYYSAASSSPVSVFGTLLRLTKFHLAKIDSKGRVIFLNQNLNEILSHIQDFPTHLNLQEQGRFAIGYYHQNQMFYTKKESVQEEKEN
ncbi:MAG: type I-C CRISPR-associated protein Cas8c/Csd1 [Sphaerochaetaceae bacterium]|nr:type I-C CRISPR-associated protein Cas8c/Csd1 [Sphaerochaetaceae bacterium]